MLQLICTVLILSSLGKADDTTTASIQESNFPSGAAELVSDYVIAADFNNKQVAQVTSASGSKEDDEKGTKGFITRRVVDDGIVNNDYPEIYYEQPTEHQNTIRLDKDQFHSSVQDAGLIHTDLVVTQRSVLAVGFIVFLMLLSSIQGNMMGAIATQQQSPSLLGGVTQAIGRRRRDVTEQSV